MRSEPDEKDAREHQHQPGVPRELSHIEQQPRGGRQGVTGIPEQVGESRQYHAYDDNDGSEARHCQNAGIGKRLVQPALKLGLALKFTGHYGSATPTTVPLTVLMSA